MPAYFFFFNKVNMELPHWTEWGFSFLQLFCEVKACFVKVCRCWNWVVNSFFLKDGMFAGSNWCLYCLQLSLARRWWLKAPWGRLMLLQIDQRETLRKPGGDERREIKRGAAGKRRWKRGRVNLLRSYSNSCPGKINGFLLPGSRHFLATIVNVE